jgi:opacity protein-like surface antigen
MNIKSLLLGSAAAMVAATGAQAADAIVVAEPEPMEYVRICDTYGTGYFYIPGTETCLKIGGYLRYDINYRDSDDSVWKLARFAPSFDARNSTEWGTLRSYAEVEFNWALNAARTGYENNVYLRHAFIDIGDQNFLRIGKAWNPIRSWVGTGSTINDQALNATTYNVGQITYAFNATNGGGIGGGIGFSGFVSVVESDGADFHPSIEAGIGYGWGPRPSTNFARLAVGYDTDEGSFMVRGGVDVALGSIANGRIAVQYVNDEPGYYRGALGGSEWSVVAGLDVKASSTVTVNLVAGWYDDGPFGAANREWEAAVGLNWQPFGNNSLQIRPEVQYISNRFGDDNFGANLRFQRNF